MKIEIKLFANLKRLLPTHAEGSTATLEVEDGLTVAALVEQLQVPKEMAQLVLVNGVNIEGDNSRTLQDGDTVSIFPPVAGGIDYFRNLGMAEMGFTPIHTTLSPVLAGYP